MVPTIPGGKLMSMMKGFAKRYPCFSIGEGRDQLPGLILFLNELFLISEGKD
jgi:hypothetical protein